MFSLAFASVPIYSIFCKATGYAGTVKRAADEDYYFKQQSSNREILIRLNADVDPNLNWKFTPHHNNLKVKVGENTLIYYTVENLNNTDSEGIAIYNVTPHKAAKYFYKVACFCFEKQTLKAKEKMVMPVSFFIDQAIINNREMEEITTLTLSYTFFRYQDYQKKGYKFEQTH